MRKLLIITAVFALAALVTAGMAGAQSGTTVRVLGEEDVVPNVKIFSNFRFSPGPVTVKSGDLVTWVNAGSTPAPHTITLVDSADLPATFFEVFGCQAPGAPCGNALAGHFPGGPGGTPMLVLDVGAAGLNTPGDSLLLFPGGSATANVSALAGSTLSYLCAIHPWMQGTINVK